ncbi:MAG: hypothetical protein QW783_02510 [Candidatus Micrarchaeia archaeon]
MKKLITKMELAFDHILLYVLILTFLSFLSSSLYAVNICPIDKNPTEITIEHSRHPINIPIGITDNTIDVNIQLNAIDRKTQNRIPLANKQVLIELVLGSKFVTKNAAGDFVLSDEPAPFPINTSENGTISFTIFTQPPLLENVTDPRKISYSITATFTPKPKEPLMGSVKTERYVPGVLPIISMTACAPLFIIFALLVAAMFASGKNPFGLFDFSRVAFKAPRIQPGRVTTRAKTTVGTALAGTAAGVLKSVLEYEKRKAMRKGLESLEKKAEELEKQGKKEEAAKVRMQAATLLDKVGRRLSIKEIKEKEKKEAELGIEKEEVKFRPKMLIKGLSQEEYKALRDRYNIKDIEKFRFGEILTASLLQAMSRLGYRPWIYAHGMAVAMERQRPINRLNKDEIEKTTEDITKTFKLTKEEIEELKKKNIKLVDENGLTPEAKKFLLEKFLNAGYIPKSIQSEFTRLGILNVNTLKTEIELIDKMKGKIGEKQIDEKIANKLFPTAEEMQNTTPKTAKNLDQLVNLLRSGDYTKAEKLINKMENNRNEMLNKIMPSIPTGRTYDLLPPLEKQEIAYYIQRGVISGNEFYKRLGIEMTEHELARSLGLVANEYGIPKDLAKAIKENDYKYIKEVYDKTEGNKEQRKVFEYIINEAGIGYALNYFGNKKDLDNFLTSEGKGGMNRDQIRDAVIKTYGYESLKPYLQNAVGKDEIEKVNYLMKERIDTLRNEIQNLEGKVPRDDTKLASLRTEYNNLSDYRKEIENRTNTLSLLKDINQNNNIFSPDSIAREISDINANYWKTYTESLNSVIKKSKEVEIESLTKDVNKTLYNAAVSSNDPDVKKQLLEEWRKVNKLEGKEPTMVGEIRNEFESLKTVKESLTNSIETLNDEISKKQAIINDSKTPPDERKELENQINKLKNITSNLEDTNKKYEIDKNYKEYKTILEEHTKMFNEHPYLEYGHIDSISKLPVEEIKYTSNRDDPINSQHLTQANDIFQAFTAFSNSSLAMYIKRVGEENGWNEKWREPPTYSEKEMKKFNDAFWGGEEEKKVNMEFTKSKE